MDCCQIVGGVSCSAAGRIDLSALQKIRAEIRCHIPVVARMVVTHAVLSTITEILHRRRNEGVSDVLDSSYRVPSTTSAG